MRPAQCDHRATGRRRKFRDDACPHRGRCRVPLQVHIEAGDIRNLARDDEARPERRRHARIEIFAAGDVVNFTRDDAQRDGDGNVQPRDCLRDVQQAEETSRERTRRIVRCLRGNAAEVDNVNPAPVPATAFAEQAHAVIGVRWIDRKRIVGDARELLRVTDGNNAVPRRRKQLPDRGCFGFPVRKNKPKRVLRIRIRSGNAEGRCPFPRWNIKPVVQVCGHRDGRGLPVRNGGGREPVDCPLEGIRRKCDASSLLSGVQIFPAYFRSAEPETPGGGEQHLGIRLTLVVVAQAGNRGRGGFARPRWMLLREDAERAARPGFEQDGIFHLPERVQRVVEARGVIRVTRPVFGIGRLGGGDPAAGDIRGERNARRAGPHLANFIRKGARDGREHPRVERVRVLHRPVRDAACVEDACKFCDAVGWPGDDAERGAVDERNGEIVREQRLEFGFRQRDREHLRRWQ